MNKEVILQIKSNMKARKISGASIARHFDKSPGWINAILRGDYPYEGAYNLPRYLYKYFEERRLLPAMEPPNTGLQTDGGDAFAKLIKALDDDMRGNLRTNPPAAAKA